MNLRQAFALLAVCCSLCLTAAEPFDPYSADIEQNMATPSVPQKHAQAVVKAMNLLAGTLKRLGYEVNSVRSGQVVTVVIPAAKLFAPNSTELRAAGEPVLHGLLPYIRRSDKFKIVLAVHSDNTGDADYAETLTANRANAIDDYFTRAAGTDNLLIIPYGLADDEPVKPNTGVANRAANRRVEISFIPTKEYIERIRKQ